MVDNNQNRNLVARLGAVRLDCHCRVVYAAIL